jgi:hypothetical protein
MASDGRGNNTARSGRRIVYHVHPAPTSGKEKFAREARIFFFFIADRERKH